MPTWHSHDRRKLQAELYITGTIPERYICESVFFLLSPYKLHLMSDLRVNDEVMSWNGSLVKTFERKPCECSPPSANCRLFSIFPHFLHKHLLMPLNQMYLEPRLVSLMVWVQWVDFLGFNSWRWLCHPNCAWINPSNKMFCFLSEVLQNNQAGCSRERGKMKDRGGDVWWDRTKGLGVVTLVSAGRWLTHVKKAKRQRRKTFTAVSKTLRQHLTEEELRWGSDCREP